MLKYHLTLPLVILFLLGNIIYAEHDCENPYSIPSKGAGLGIQVSLPKHLIGEFTVVPLMSSYQLKTDNNFSTATYSVRMIDVLIKKYYASNQYLQLFITGGIWWAGYWEASYQVTGGAPVIPEATIFPIKQGYGGALGGGIRYLLSSRFSLDGMVSGRFPMPLLLHYHENGVNQFAISFKLSVSFLI
jgi:hypothetical protein